MVEKARVEEQVTGGLKRTDRGAPAGVDAGAGTKTRKLSAGSAMARRGRPGALGRADPATSLPSQAGLLQLLRLHARWYPPTPKQGRRRRTRTVKLPGGGVFVIDAKCSLNAFLELQEADGDAEREAAGLRHVQSVRGHIAGLSAKAYWDQFEGSPDFVAMFVPLDSALAAAVDRAPALMTEAMDKKVVIVTPTTLFALCKAVVYGWRVEEQAANARTSLAEPRARQAHRHHGAARAGSAQGKALGKAVARCNQFVGSPRRPRS